MEISNKSDYMESLDYVFREVKTLQVKENRRSVLNVVVSSPEGKKYGRKNDKRQDGNMVEMKDGRRQAGFSTSSKSLSEVNR